MAVARPKWTTEFEKHCIVANCVRRGWQRVGRDDDWNFFWVSVCTTHRIFNVENGIRLNDNQVLACYHCL